MKFEIGDTVRVGTEAKKSCVMGKYVGMTGKIKSWFGEELKYYYLDIPHEYFFCEDELEFVSSFLQSFPEISPEVVKQSNTETSNKETKMTTSTFVMPPHVLVKHSKNKNGRKIGTVVAAKIDGTVRLGWSKCNTNVDSFDYVTGIQFALMSAAYDPSNILASVPQSLQADYTEMKDRARRYFLKIGNHKKVTINQNKIAEIVKEAKTSFAVGDRVRVVANPKNSPVVASRMDQIGTISKKRVGSRYDWDVKFSDDYADSFYSNELELYVDKKKCTFAGCGCQH